VAKANKTPKPVKKAPKKSRVRKMSMGGTITPSQMYTTNTLLANRAVVTNRKTNDTITVTNQEVFKVLVGGATDPWQAKSVTYLTPPQLFWGKNIAQNYAMYRFKRVCLEYKPVVGTAQNGYVALGFFTDPEDGVTFNSGSSTISQLAQCRRFVQGPIWSPMQIDLDSTDFNNDWYFYQNSPSNAADSRLANAGSLGTVTVTNSSLTTGTAGIVYVTYELELKDPVSVTVQT